MEGGRSRRIPSCVRGDADAEYTTDDTSFLSRMTMAKARYLLCGKKRAPDFQLKIGPRSPDHVAKVGQVGGQTFVVINTVIPRACVTIELLATLSVPCTTICLGKTSPLVRWYCFHLLCIWCRSA